MNNKSQKTKIANQVFSKIKEGQIKMRSKRYFIFRSFLFISGIIAIILLALYLVSFIIFILCASGIWYISDI